MKRRRSKLIPSVAALIGRGLSPVDGEWIGRLPAASQEAAARKCCAPNFTPVLENLPNRSRLGGGNGRPGRDAS